MNDILNLLVFAHITFGVLSFAGAATAIASRAASLPHHWHQTGGRLFFWSMAGIFVTGLPMSLLNANIPLLFISLFSFYLAWMGRRYALNRRGEVTPADRLVVAGALAVFTAMATYGLYMLVALSSSAGIVILVFGAIGLTNAVGDYRLQRGGGATGARRLAQHLGKMLGGTIAIVTAFAVTNIDFEPGYVVWLAPAVIITPLIIFWSARVQSGRKLRT